MDIENGKNKDKQDKSSLNNGQSKNVDKDTDEKNENNKGDTDMEALKEYVNVQNPKDNVSTEEMKRYLHLDSIKPITINSTDEKDKQEKGDCFDEWYAEELREIYKRCK